MIKYDTFRVLSHISRSIDSLLDGLWDSVEVERETLIQEARGLLDEAAQVVETSLPEHLHPYVGDDDVAYIAASLATDRCQGWDTVETALAQVESEAAVRYQNALLRGDA